MFRPFPALAALSAVALSVFPCAAEEAPAAAEPAAAPAEEAPSAAEAAESPAEPSPTDPVILIDGKPAVLRSELEEQVALMLKNSPFGELGGGDFAAYLRPQVARQLAMKSVLLREARARGTTVADEDRTAALAEFGVTNLAEFAETVGVPLEKIERDLSDGLLIDKFLKEAAPAPEITDEKVRATFDEIVAQNPEATHVDETVRASHILVAVDEDASEEEVAAARAKIDAARKRVLDGEDFALVASEVSDCPSANEGGDLGEFTRDRMVAPFSEAAFSQEVGAVGEVVRTSFGFHVIRVAEHKPARDVTFEDVRDMIRTHLAEEAADETRQTFIEGLMEKAKVEYVGIDMDQKLPMAGPFSLPDDEDEDSSGTPAEEAPAEEAPAPAEEAPAAEPAA